LKKEIRDLTAQNSTLFEDMENYKEHNDELLEKEGDYIE